MSNEDIIEDDAVKLLQRIVGEAKKDGILTDDEKQIIDIIQRHLWDVENEIELLVESGKNTPEMVEELTKMMHTIVLKAEEVANEDGQITEDEKSLLDTLDSYITSGRSTELLIEYINKFL
ncbi:MAG: hypothetical protein ACXAE3_13285 [Candidatus Kariarchaeaceae archaeon]|jgi:hypothetical protein